MKKDYTALDAEIILAITGEPVSSYAISSAALTQAKLLETTGTPWWRIVDRRMQALRHMGLIRYTREGWVKA
jgi:hypothetical protein